MGVDLGGDEAFVAEQLLDATDVCAAVEQVRRKTVAEGVGAGAAVEARLFEVFFEHASDAARRETGSKTIDKDRGRTVGWFFVGELPLGEPGFQRAQGKRTERGEALFASFTPDADDALGEIEIAVVEVDQFADAEAGGVERFEDCPIAEAHGRFARRGTEQFAYFGGREKVRQLVGLARVAEGLGWIVVDPVFTLREAIKTAERG